MVGVASTIIDREALSTCSNCSKLNDPSQDHVMDTSPIAKRPLPGEPSPLYERPSSLVEALINPPFVTFEHFPLSPNPLTMRFYTIVTLIFFALSTTTTLVSAGPITYGICQTGIRCASLSFIWLKLYRSQVATPLLWPATQLLVLLSGPLLLQPLQPLS